MRGDETLAETGGVEEVLAFCLLEVVCCMRKKISSSMEEDFIEESGSWGALISRVSAVVP